MTTSIDLSVEYRHYLQFNQISTAYYQRLINTRIPRYIQCMNRGSLTLNDIKNNFLQQPHIIVQCTVIPHVYQLMTTDLHHKINVSHTPLYQLHHIHGMDIASIICCYVLLGHHNHTNQHILDICVAPGNKLLCINNQCTNSYITGVDCSYNRLCTTRSLCRKYIQPGSSSNNHIQLCLCDGTKYNQLSSSSNTTHTNTNNTTTTDNNYNHIIDLTTDGDCCNISDIDRKVLKKQNKRHTHPSKSDNHKQLYDRILVDAECTHDGSVSHILKYSDTSHGTLHLNHHTFQQSFMNNDRLSSLQSLQRNLLINSFGLLQCNGVLVYSTCSLLRAQNEEIIEWFISQYPDQIQIVDNVFDNSVLYSEVYQNNSKNKLYDHRLIYQIHCRYDSMTEDQINTDRIPPLLYESTPIRNITTNDIIGHSIRFDPLVSNTSGLFVCKMMKVSKLQ